MEPNTETDASILLLLAKKTKAEARAAWIKEGGTVEGLRAAFHACILAKRFARRAAEAWASDERVSHALTEDADKLEIAAVALNFRLVHAQIAAEDAGVIQQTSPQ